MRIRQSAGGRVEREVGTDFGHVTGDFEFAEAHRLDEGSEEIELFFVWRRGRRWCWFGGLDLNDATRL